MNKRGSQAPRELEQQRSRRHSPDSEPSFRSGGLPFSPPRCTCGLPLRKAGRSRFSTGSQDWSGLPDVGEATHHVVLWVRKINSVVKSKKQLQDRDRVNFEELRDRSEKCPDLLRDLARTMERIPNPIEGTGPALFLYLHENSTLSNFTLSSIQQWLQPHLVIV